MNLRCCLLIGSVLLALLGCKSAAPRSAREGGAATASATTNHLHHPSGKTVSLDQQAFTVVATTNQLDPLWLRAPTNFFRLGPGDVIEIEMLGEATSRSSAVVGPDGKIYYGLLPGTFVWGLSLSEAKRLLDQ